MSIKKPNRTILIGPLPPPLNGQNLAFLRAVKFFEEHAIPFVVIDIADRSQIPRADGTFTNRRVFEILHAIVNYLKQIWLPHQTVYLTIAQTFVGFMRDFVFIWLAVFRGHRIVLHLHGGGFAHFVASQPMFLNRLIVKTLCQADRILVLGEYLKEQFQFLPASGPTIGIVPNCLPKDIKVPTHPRTRCNKNSLRVLYLSNLLESKGYREVLKAVEILIMKGLALEADFCGAFLSASDSTDRDPTAAKEAFLTAIDAPFLSGTVRYHGVVDGEKKEEILNNADVFVLPTYYVNEGQPISIIEALAYGLPVISTDYRGIPEMVKDGVNGFLVAPRNEAAIAACLEQLYHSPELFERMSRASLERFKELFETSMVGTKLIKEISGSK